MEDLLTFKLEEGLTELQLQTGEREGLDGRLGDRE